MLHFKFDLNVQLVLIAIRKLRGLKQITLAQSLNLDRTSYCRIESGKAAITPGRLRAIVKELRTTTDTVSIIANSFEIIDIENTSVGEIYKNFMSKNLMMNISSDFSNDELQFIFSIIKRFSSKVVHANKTLAFSN